MAVMAKKFNNNIILVNLMSNPGEGKINSPESLLLNFLLLTYHHSHFLATTIDFTSFLPCFSWEPHIIFTDWKF